MAHVISTPRRVAVNKSAPDAAWIEDLRRRFPVERELDRILTEKMRKRAGPGYTGIDLGMIAQGLDRLLEARIGRPFEVRDLRWLGGGASKLQAVFDLHRAHSKSEKLVLRMELPEGNVATSRRREFDIMRAMAGTLPVPQVHWIDAYAEFLPHPAIVSSFVTGVTKPTNRVSQVTGLGIDFGPELRGRLGRQVVKHMATMHRWDWRAAELPSFDTPQLGTQALQWQYNFWRRTWEEDAPQEEPLMSVAAMWLADHMPAIDALSLVHGDARAGNFLFDESSSQITAWLDWELARIGDRHDDLAFLLLRSMGHYAEDRTTFLANGLMPEEELIAEYEAAYGAPVDRRRLEYYQVFHAWRCSIILLAAGSRAVMGGKTNQDMTMTIMLGFGGRMLDELRELLERYS